MRYKIKTQFNKILVSIIAFAMVLAIVQPALVAKASDISEVTDGSIQDYNDAAYENYEEAEAATVNDVSQLNDSELVDNTGLLGASSVNTYSTVATAADYVREQMVARKSTITFAFVNTQGLSERDIYYLIKDEVFKETGVYNEGAYLRWNWSTINVKYQTTSNVITYNYNVGYLSSAYQESLIDKEVARLLNNEFAGWQNMHDYKKVKMVYEWVTSTYEYVEGDSNHSTYSGIINHKTVCQGFSTTLYRILGEMGLSVRVVENGDHGWNIVQLGKYYYSMDATWDVGRAESGWNYFLIDEGIFSRSHTRGSEYNTTEYHLLHPMGTGTYNYNVEMGYVSVYYKTHVQSYGWQNYVYDGAQSGTTGSSKRLEGIQIKLANKGNYDIGVEYMTHIQSYGWESTWRKEDTVSGTTGQAKRLEAIRIKLTGSDAGKFDIYYRVHAQSYGWLGWAKNGQEAGTAGQSKRLEAIEIVVLPKGETPGGMLGYAYVDYGMGSKSKNPSAGLVNYKTHVQSYGWQGYVYDGSISGTSGKSKRLEGICISLGNTGYSGGIQYQTHIQSYGWEKDWKRDGVMSGTQGQAKRLEGIRIQLYGDVAQYYDVYYRVHAQSFGWLDWAKNGADAGTAGLSKRLEAIQIVILPKGSVAPGNTARPFVSR